MLGDWNGSNYRRVVHGGAGKTLHVRYLVDVAFRDDYQGLQVYCKESDSAVFNNGRWTNHSPLSGDAELVIDADLGWRVLCLRWDV